MSLNFFHPGNFEDVIEQMKASIGETAAGELNKEMRPIIEKLAMLGPSHLSYGPGANKDDAIKQLSNWLKDKKRTVEEFSYVVGPLGIQVCKYMRTKGLPEKVGNIIFEYLGFEAAEALAIKSPALEGPWEHAAWFVVYLKKHCFWIS
ncbi:unnamed protein product [Meganyctiphanes norvegica]|uniref:Uncharacterized protein n=1 Tax=Meganyctiphanes norvegica TaxID=48144 RepID=A0AAV2RAY6_MEGNR